MGNLTTLTIYNDGAHLLKSNAQEFADGVYDAMGRSLNQGAMDVSVGNFANFVRVQQPRHADHHTVYVHMGNCVTEMNAYSADTQNLLKNNPEVFEKRLDALTRQTALLSKMLKAHKAKAKETAE